MLPGAQRCQSGDWTQSVIHFGVGTRFTEGRILSLLSGEKFIFT